MIDQQTVSSLAPDMIGNGGFCVRDKQQIVRVLDQWRIDAAIDANLLKKWNVDLLQLEKIAPLKGCSNEDVFYAKAFTILGCKFPSRTTALEFSIEQIGPVSWPKEKGQAVALECHKPWVYLAAPLVKAILERAEYNL